MLRRSLDTARTRAAVRLPPPGRCSAAAPGRGPRVPHRECRLLPGRYRVDRPAGGPRVVAAHRRRDGRPTCRARVRRRARPPARRAGRDPQLRVQRGRWALCRHRHLAGRTADPTAARCRGPPWRGPADRPVGGRHDDRDAGGDAVRRSRTAALRGHERGAAPDRARLPTPHAHARAVRLRRRLQVAHRARADDLRRRRRLLDRARLVTERTGQDGLAHRSTRAVHPPRPRDGSGRRGRMGPGPRDLGGRGPGRRRAVAARHAPARAVGEHVGAVALRLGGDPRQPHAAGARDRRHRRVPSRRSALRRSPTAPPAGTPSW